MLKLGCAHLVLAVLTSGNRLGETEAASMGKRGLFKLDAVREFGVLSVLERDCLPISESYTCSHKYGSNHLSFEKWHAWYGAGTCIKKPLGHSMSHPSC